MIGSLKGLDIFVFIAGLVMLLFAGFRKPDRAGSASDYFMAERNLPWWSVAGSIYGTNVSLSQIIGMLGIGYSIGFAQSHYEFLAIPAILVLCHVFIPVYRRRNAFTLSEFLGDRYDESARTLYTLILLAVIVILLVGGLYIGSRQLMLLFSDTAFQPSYGAGIIGIATAACALVFLGGMKAVVRAENIITVLMVLTVITVGVCTLHQPEIGGFSGLLKLDSSPDGLGKMNLYLPSDHPDLPWTGVFSGLLVLHGFFWTTNQFEVQRALAARSDRDAQLGAIAAGFLKLTIPFFSISAGVAAAYLLRHEPQWNDVKPDDAFLYLLGRVVPQGYGLMGLILAGFLGAIFSSIYSMLNSLSTIVAVDLYRRHIRPEANDRQLVAVGRMAVVAACLIGTALAWWSFSPDSAGNFFLTLSKNTSYLKPGIVSAFLLGVLWKRTHRRSAMVAILAAPVLSFMVEWGYQEWLSHIPAMQALMGQKLNFLHRVFVVFVACLTIQFLMTITDPGKETATSEEIRIQPVSLIGLVRYFAVQAVMLAMIVLSDIRASTLALPAALLGLVVTTGFARSRNSVAWWGSLLMAGVTWALYFFT